MLFIIHSAMNVIDHVQKQSEKFFINAAITQKVFENSSKKKLAIFIFINDYNYNMNDVDIANQMQASYTTHQIIWHNWLSILYWILNTAIINVFHIQHIYKKQQEIYRKNEEDKYRQLQEEYKKKVNPWWSSPDKLSYDYNDPNNSFVDLIFTK